jgi:hypothetical protein
MKLKLFLTYTAIIEGVTGIFLVIMPSRFILLLFKMQPNGGGDIILIMIAGVAILSLAILCWLFKDQERARPVVFMLLFYNVLVTAVVVYGTVKYLFNGSGLLAIICFHLFQSIICAVLIAKKTGKIF